MLPTKKKDEDAPEPPPLEMKKVLLEKPVSGLVRKEVMDSTQLKAFCSENPFPHMVVPDILDENFARLLKDALLHEEFYLKSNDLYDFTQTKDLCDCTEPTIKKFREITSELRGRLSEVFDVKLKAKFDAFGAIYKKNGKLLCHDDRMPGRAIAYIMYLVPPSWGEKDGGALTLFNTNESNSAQPSDVAKELVPQFNSLVAFRVSTRSFHQVNEVLSASKARISIAGWFYYAENQTQQEQKINQQPKGMSEEPLPEFVPLCPSKTEAASLVGRTYRKPSMVKRVNKAFMDESSIELRDFLRKDIYTQVAKAFLDPNLAWSRVGPSNKRSYLQLNIDQKSTTGAITIQKSSPTDPSAEKDDGGAEKDDDDGAEKAISSSSNPKKKGKNKKDSKQQDTGDSIKALEDLLTFLKSDKFAEVVSQLTGLTITSCALEVRQFDKGHYTLAHDEDPYMKEEGLDVVLCVFAHGVSWKNEYGGTVHYVEGDEELLTVDPHPNTLSLVYRAEGGTSRFVKYVNSASPCPRFDVSCTFEVADDDDDDNEEEDN